jgi:hypothetical protein
MKDTMEAVLYIIMALGGIAGIVLLLSMTVLAIRSGKEEQAREARQEERDKQYHERRMKELEAHRD